jgi:tetratricopeptide (TPR) repeat protein
MASGRLCLVFGVVAAAAAAGCTAPSVQIEHVLPGAVPLPPGVGRVRAGGFAVVAGPRDEFARHVQRVLDERLAEFRMTGQAAGEREAAAGAPAANVGGTIHVETQDKTSTRTVRRWNPAAGKTEDREAASLTRLVEVRVVFAISGGDSPKPTAVAELSRSYDSTADPRTRGELGLERVDDPRRVPPAETIVRELLSECVSAFCEMVAPVKLTAEVRLRPMIGEGWRGLVAAGKGDLTAAAASFEAVVKAAPQSADARFNLAAALEAKGQLRQALSHYREALEQAQGKDPEAADGVRRIERVLLARERLGG